MAIIELLIGAAVGGAGCWFAVMRSVEKRNAAVASVGKCYHSFVNALPLGVIGIDAAGVVTYWNAAAGTLFGWKDEEAIGHPLPLAPDGLSAKALREWSPGAEGKVLRKDGSQAEVAIWTARTPHAVSDGTTLLGIVVDISRYRPPEQHLRESEERYRYLVENARDLVCTVDMDCNFTSVNRACVETTGYSREELLKMNLADMVSASDMAILRIGIQRRLRTLTGGSSLPDLTYRLNFKMKNGSWMYGDARPRIALEGGRPVGFHVIIRDITEDKRWEDALGQKNRELADALEAARQATDVKSQFLANTSHEIRTPMNGVIATAELLAGTDLDTSQREYVDMIRSSARSLLRVINDILDISKIEAGKLELVPAPFSPAAVLAEVESLLKVPAANKSLKLRSEIERAIPKRVRGDAIRLRQILLNLVGNAVKFTDAGEIVVRAVVYSNSPDRVVLRFAVKDSGIGISKEDAARLFGGFVQADKSPSRREGGTGLGLAISKQLVELMGGSIGLDSQVGRGSTFWFTAAFEKANEADEDEDEATPSAPAASFAGTTVLVAEDNEVNRTIITRMLEHLGCTVDAVGDGREAVNAASLRPYNLIFMDGQMPNLSGLAAAKEIRSAEAGKRHTPIIAVTASAMVGDRDRCLSSGMDDYITKPLSLDDLTAILSRWAGTKR